MGKYFSRFLTHFSPEHAAALRAHNGRRPGFMVAELSDDPEFSFNGNLHPQLAEHEISYPARVSGISAGTGLPLVDLRVEPDPANSWRLRLLHHPSGREVLPVDLGFLTQLRRPPLFRVLSMFSPCFQDGTPIPWRTGAPDSPERRDGGVVRRPRVVFERALVVARASWQVPTDTLSGLVAGLPPGAAFRVLDRWRRSHAIPRHVFVVAEGQARAGRGLRRARGTRKPQYVDLESAALSELLLETAAAHRGILVLHEMLPGPESMPRRRGGRTPPSSSCRWTVTPDSPPAAADRDPDPERATCLDAARGIAAHLCASARWRGDACHWADSGHGAGVAGGEASTAAGGRLELGSAGVALFLLRLHGTEADDACVRTARGALAHALECEAVAGWRTAGTREREESPPRAPSSAREPATGAGSTTPSPSAVCWSASPRHPRATWLRAMPGASWASSASTG
jgi:hypothetical protein